MNPGYSGGLLTAKQESSKLEAVSCDMYKAFVSANIQLCKLENIMLHSFLESHISISLPDSLTH